MFVKKYCVFALMMLMAVGCGNSSSYFESEDGFEFSGFTVNDPLNEIYDGAILYNGREIAYYREKFPGPSLHEARFDVESMPFLFGLDSGVTHGLGLQVESLYYGSGETEMLPPGLEIEEDSDFLTLRAVVIQKKNGGESELKVDTTVTIDSDTDGFTWTVDKTVTILGGDILNKSQIEVVDTYVPGAVHYKSHIYRHLLLGHNGNINRIPVNMTQSAHKYGWDFPAGENFWWTFGVDPDGINPMLEMLDHNGDIHAAICWRFLDVHLWVLPFDRDAGFRTGETYTVRYRFANRSSEETKRLVEASRLRPEGLPAGDIFPLYTPPYNGFQPGLGASGISSLRNFTWLRRYETNPPVGMETVQDPACIWSDDGCDDPGSLAIFADDAGPHAWQVRVPDSHPNIYPPARTKSVLISVWIKTEAVRGENGGARLLYQIGGQPPLVSESVSGNTDWTRIDLPIPEDYRANLSHESVLKLVAEGPIRAWFDGLEYDTGVSAGNIPSVNAAYPPEITTSPGAELTLEAVGATPSGAVRYQWHQRQRPEENRILPLLIEDVADSKITFRIPENARGGYYVFPEIYDGKYGFQRFGEPTRITVQSPETRIAFRVMR